MTFRFEHTASAEATEIRLLGPAGAVPTDLWAVEAPSSLLPGVDLAQRLVAAGSAIAEGDTLLVEHATIAGLTPREAGLLGLPPLAEVRAVIQGNGLLTRPDFSACLLWQRPTGQPVLGAERIGAWLRIGGALRRLPDTLFAIAEAVDRLNAAPAEDMAGRLAAIAELREALPIAEADGGAEARGMLGRLTIVQADAFSLDLEGEGDDARLVPILHRAAEEGDAPLLPPERQRAFGEDQFHRFSTARPHYTLGDGWIVVLSPPLRRALSEVRRVASAPAATRRALLASPRAFLRQALGDEVEGTVLENVFRETTAWSDRVVGLGLWQPRALDAAPDRPCHRIEFFCNRLKHFRRSEAPPRMPRATVRGTASDDRPQLPRHGPERPHPHLDQVLKTRRSNRYLELAPVVVRLAIEAGAPSCHLRTRSDAGVLRRVGAEVVAVAAPGGNLDFLADDG